MRLAVGAKNVAAGKAHVRVRHQIGQQVPYRVFGGESIGIQDVDQVGTGPVRQAQPDAEVVARTKAAIPPGLHHPDARVSGKLGGQRLERAVARIIVDHGDRAGYVAHRDFRRGDCAQGHRCGPPIEDDSQYGQIRAGFGHGVSVPLRDRSRKAAQVRPGRISRQSRYRRASRLGFVSIRHNHSIAILRTQSGARV